MCEMGHGESRRGQDGFGNTFPDRIQQMLYSLRTREPKGELYARCEETLLGNLSSSYLLTRGEKKSSPCIPVTSELATHSLCVKTNLLIFFSSDTNNWIPKFDLCFRVDRATGIKFY